jgi:multidrug efflux system membrane fusion protein
LASSLTRRPWRLAGVSLVLVAGVWFVLRSQAEAPPAAARQAPPVRATLVQVMSENLPNFLDGVGTAQPLATVTVKTRVDGQLERVGFTEGQDVKAGQVLAQLDARPFRAQLDQVQAQKARDEAQLANARTDLARYAGLIKEDATTQQTVDTQQALVQQLQAAVRTDAAQVEYAQLQLAYATVTSPLSGRVGARLVDPGNIVHATDTGGLVVINQIDPIAVLFTLPGDAVQAINLAQRATAGGRRLAVLAYGRNGGALLARGELVLVNNQIDTASGTVQLKAHFANATHKLWPGQYVDVRLDLGEFHGALTVPAGVIQRSQAGTYAYVVGPDRKVEMRPLQVLKVQDGKALIARGLKVGETVVLDGQYKLKPGVTVAAAGPSSSSASGASAGAALGAAMEAPEKAR